MESWKEQLIKELHEVTQKHVEELGCIMDRMGIEESIKPQWIEVTKDQVIEAFKIVLENAKDLQEQLIASIEQLLQRSEDLCKQLRIKMPPYGSENLNLGQEKALLKRRITEYEDKIEKRLYELKSLKKRQNDACKSLGCEPIPIQESPLPTVEEIDKLSAHIEGLENEKFKRESKFLEVKCKILDLVQELEIKPSLEIEKTVCSVDDSLFLVTDYNMNWIDQYYESLVQQKLQTENEIAHLREKVCLLWEKLDEDIKRSNEFLQKHTGNSVTTLEAFQQEVKRCDRLKKANIEKFIKTMREELMQYWDKCHFSSTDRESFEYFHDNLYTEDLLTFHEIEVDKMRAYYQKHKETLLMLERREEYWKRLTELEDRENDPNRYKNRGGTLLKEEKERNGLTKKLREMEIVLLDIAVKFEEEYNKPFLSWGQSIPDIIEKTREDYENVSNKKQHLSAKKQQRNLTPTPVKSGFLGSTLSGSKRNLLTLTPAPSTPGTSSSKRKLPPTSLFSSSKKRTPLRVTPSIKLNDHTLIQKTKEKDPVQKRRLRYSQERKKRMDKIRRLSKVLTEKRQSNEFTDYDAFEAFSALSDSTYRAAVVEYYPVQDYNLTPDERTVANVKNYVKLIDELDDSNLDIVVFPEWTITKGVSSKRKTLVEISIEVPEKSEGAVPCGDNSYPQFFNDLSCLAKNHSTYLVVNLLEKKNCTSDDCASDNWNLYNTNVVFDRSGTVIQKYRKFNPFGEPEMNITKEAEIATFETDFDVTFALQAQEMYAIENDVVLLASGANSAEQGSGGSGIFQGKLGAVQLDLISNDGSKVIVANVLKEWDSSTVLAEDTDNEADIDKLGKEMDSFHLKHDNVSVYGGYRMVAEELSGTFRYNDVECQVSWKMSYQNITENHYDYALLYYSGVRSFDRVRDGGIDVCAVVFCQDLNENNEDYSNCGSRYSSYDTIQWTYTIEEITISANFTVSDSAIQYPSTLLSSIRPLDKTDYEWSSQYYDNNKIVQKTIKLTKPQDRLLVFGIYGRDFSRDSGASWVTINHLLFAATVLGVLLCVN
ncbi:biotinidase-related [Holotrichia oblita]|uniref:Biotinidase-related n=1 Tax=Holotrichia oblita TaxID=644536 RepID=A0ACB9SK55_HOLOL|nr:biotinidase-related [Holotrichia oblita]